MAEGKVAAALASLAIALGIIGFLTVSLYNEQTMLIEKVNNISEALRSISVKAGSAVNFATTYTVRETVTVTVTKNLNWASEVYERVKGSVVLIETIRGVTRSTGTGFVYDVDGHVITNEHVINSGDKFYVRFIDGTVREARLVGSDQYTDLAVLKIDPSGLELKPLPIGDSDSLKIGDEVAVVGNPYGLELGWTLTTGVVSQKGRLYEVRGGYAIPDMIQIDAAVNPGNSGSPLLNSRGEVVGVVSAIRSESGGFEGIGYAISASVVKKVIPVLIERGSYQHSWLGVRGQDVDLLVSERMGLKVSHGFLITETVPNGPADRAGLRSNDVIVSLNGVKVQGLADILSYLLVNTAPGDVVTVTVVRGEEVLSFDVRLGVRPG